MKIGRTLAALVFFLSGLGSPVFARQGSVRIQGFEINSKETHRRFRIFLYLNGRQIETKRAADSFVVPDEARRYEYIGVRIISGRYNLYFNSVHISKFKDDWIVGIDKTLNQWYLKKEEIPLLKQVNYLIFRPNDGEGTVLSLKVYKNGSR